MRVRFSSKIRHFQTQDQTTSTSIGQHHILLRLIIVPMISYDELGDHVGAINSLVPFILENTSLDFFLKSVT
jgi:hypothetical protein